MDSVVTALIEAKRGLLVAPAGCGKTRLIAQAVALKGTPGRELILTHTHAGVSAIRRYLRLFGVTGPSARVETISSWALRYAASYPQSSGLKVLRPETTEQWDEVHLAATKLLKTSPLARVVKSSYCGLFVDEYQDCSHTQHELILRIADLLPCRVLGDPLQGVFDFSECVDWNADVIPNFDLLPILLRPWRWEQPNASPDLGRWLLQVRTKLETGQDVCLANAPVTWRQLDPSHGTQAQLAECQRLARNRRDSIVAIHKWPQQHQKLTSLLGGLYTCVEAIDCVDLLRFAEKFEQSRTTERAAVVLEFAAKCMTRVKSQLRPAIKAYSGGRVYKAHGSTNAAHLAALEVVASNDRLSTIEPALESVVRLPKNAIHRQELYEEMVRSLREFETGRYTSLREAAWCVRSRTRHRGRTLSLRVAGSALLVKGMEFQHSLVLDADQLNAKELYVAMTRGAGSLTVLSKRSTLRPAGTRHAPGTLDSSGKYNPPALDNWRGEHTT